MAKRAPARVVAFYEVWTYSQATGELKQDGKLVGTGYSGRNVPDGPQGRDNPELEGLPNVGPIPRGLYNIKNPIPVAHNAPPVFPLTPNGHDARGRSGFQIHGNNVRNDASRGCIIMDFPVRAAIRKTIKKDSKLEVTA